MRYALEKLIAFTFLLGIAGYAYHDFEELREGAGLVTLATLTAIFGVFYLLVPRLVVAGRIRRRRRVNAERYAEWRATLGGRSPEPLRVDRRWHLEDGERAYWHEKGTWYLTPGTAYDEKSTPGRIGEVAFPGERGRWRKVQRAHCVITDRAVRFMAKTAECTLPRDGIAAVDEAPGGLMFATAGNSGQPIRFAFTFRNPAAAAEVYRCAQLRRCGDGRDGSLTRG